MEYVDFGKENKKNIMQEPKKVQFDLRNSTTRDVSIDLFNASSLTPITGETQFEAGVVNTLSPFNSPTNGFYNPLTNETVLFNTQDGIGVVNQENSTMSVFLNEPININNIVAMVLNTTNNYLYVGNNKNYLADTNVLVLDAITYGQITEITIPNPTSDISIMDMSYSPVNNYIYVSTVAGGGISEIFYIDCSTNTLAGSILIP